MSNPRATLTIAIRPAEEYQLAFLEEQFSPQSLSENHHRRYAVQARSDGMYLIAWSDDTPIGHLLLIWEAPDEDVARGYPPRTAYLQSGGTREAYRRKGVMTRLIDEAERLAAEEGYRSIGLAVGSTDNPVARRLYERLGYRDWGKGEVTLTWEYARRDGRTGTESEVCIYMFKDLRNRR